MGNKKQPPLGQMGLFSSAPTEIPAEWWKEQTEQVKKRDEAIVHCPRCKAPGRPSLRRHPGKKVFYCVYCREGDDNFYFQVDNGPELLDTTV